MLSIGLVLGLKKVLGLAHFTFCHTSSPQKPAGPQARILPITFNDAERGKTELDGHPSVIKLAFHDADTLATILATVAWMSVSVSASWNASLTELNLVNKLFNFGGQT